MKTVQRLCDELEESARSNEHLEAMLNAVIEAAGEDWQDVDDLPNVIKRMRQELDLKSASGYPVSTSQGMLLAGMDSEPVAEVLSNRPGNDTSTIDRALPVGTQLYRHAQPAPVVPDEMPEELLKPLLIKWDEYEFSSLIAQDIWNACRAAMLNQAPVKQPSSKPKSELLQRAEKLAEDTAALAQRVQCEDLRAKVRSEHAEWATATFGNTGPIGPLKHLSAEALEAAAAPDDLSEWADMQFLFWDAQRKAGISDEQITQAMVAKLQVNKARQWPEPKEGEPRFHIKDGE